MKKKKKKAQMQRSFLGCSGFLNIFFLNEFSPAGKIEFTIWASMLEMV